MIRSCLIAVCILLAVPPTGGRYTPKQGFVPRTDMSVTGYRVDKTGKRVEWLTVIQADQGILVKTPKHGLVEIWVDHERADRVYVLAKGDGKAYNVNVTTSMLAPNFAVVHLHDESE